MASPPGLRERKKQRTRQALVDASIRLFSERGYTATTVADIAEAAEVSTRTFFQYFPSKDDVLLVDSDERMKRLWALASERRPGETVIGAVRGAIFELIEESVRQPPAMGQVRLEVLATTEALQAPIRQRLARHERDAAVWLARELGAEPDSVEIRVAATALVHGLWVVVYPRVAAIDPATGDQGIRRGTAELRDDVDRALRLLDTGISTLERPAPG